MITQHVKEYSVSSISVHFWRKKNIVYFENLLDLLVLFINELSKVFGSFQLNLAL